MDEMEERRSTSSNHLPVTATSAQPTAGARVILRHSRSQNDKVAVTRVTSDADTVKRHSTPPATLMTSSLNGDVTRTKTEVVPSDWVTTAPPSDVINVHVNSLEEVRQPRKEVVAERNSLLVDLGLPTSAYDDMPLSPLTHLSVSNDVTDLDFFSVSLDDTAN